MRSLMRTLVLDGGVAEMHGSETTKKTIFWSDILGDTPSVVPLEPAYLYVWIFFRRVWKEPVA